MKPEQIFCAKCCKPVDKVEWCKDKLENVITIKVFCHKETEQMELNLFDLSYKTLKQLETAPGIAFETKRIENDEITKLV